LTDKKQSHHDHTKRKIVERDRVVEVTTQQQPLKLPRSNTVMAVPSIIVLNRSCNSSNIIPSSTETYDLEDDNGSTENDTESLAATESDTVNLGLNVLDAVAYDLTKQRALRYDVDVNPNQKPRPVDKVWSDLVRLFKEPLSENESKATTLDKASIEEPVIIRCPEELKNVLKKAYEHENHLNVELFNTLRNCLAKEKVIDDVKVITKENMEDDQHNKTKKKAVNNTENDTLDVTAKHDETNKPIIFKHGKFNGYAIGFLREANGEQRHESQSASSGSTGKRKRDENMTLSPGNSQQTDSGVGASMTGVDHCACLFRDIKGKREVMCLSVMELKLAEAPVKCAAIPKGTTGKALADSLDLCRTRGSIAHVMLYTMEWVLPTLAKLGQLKEEIPWGVVVCKHQLNEPTANSPYASKPTLWQSSSNTASKSTSQKSTSDSPPLPPTKSDWINASYQISDGSSPSANNATTPSDASFDAVLSNGSMATESHRSNRWVSGKIYVPEACGDFFRYAVTGFGSFETANQKESVDNALSIYLDTLLVGLRAAKVWLDAYKEGKSCRSCPTSGQVLMIGSTKLTLPPETKSDQAKTAGEEFLPQPGGIGKLGTSRQAETIDEATPGPRWSGRLGIRHRRPPFSVRKRLGSLAKVARQAFSKAEKIGEPMPNPLLSLRGRLGKLADVSPNDTRTYPSEWKIHQGEIFTGALNIHRLAQEVGKLHNFLVFNDQDSEVKVAVKVSSAAVHDYLTDPKDASAATSRIHEQTSRIHEQMKTKKLLDYIQSNGLTLPQDFVSEDSKPSLTPPMLNDVLLAVYSAPNGLITIMKDLSEDYDTLRPSQYENDLPCLWAAFIELLRNVLIPMANLEVIHPDIRPGYDETSNILCKFKKGKGRFPVMKIIDFESILLVDQWTAPVGAQSLYIRSKKGWNAKNFLWWQCVALAYAWKNGTTQKEMAACDLDVLVQQYESDGLHPWLQMFYEAVGPQKEMDFYLLDKVANVITGNDVWTYKGDVASSKTRAPKRICVLSKKRDT
jgi:hypothetical protein